MSCECDRERRSPVSKTSFSKGYLAVFFFQSDRAASVLFFLSFDFRTRGVGVLKKFSEKKKSEVTVVFFKMAAVAALFGLLWMAFTVSGMCNYLPLFKCSFSDVMSLSTLLQTCV